MISDAEAGFILTVRVLAGTTCVLSILGACLIIFTYAAFKDLRTLARQQLVNLSVADTIVAASHFVGVAALNIDDYQASYDDNPDYNSSNSTLTETLTAQDALCRVQGGFTMLGTLASFLWTLALGFYMLMVIVLKRPDYARYLLFVYYPACWGIPLALTLWFALVKPIYLGFGEGADIVWCYVRVVPDSSGQIDHSATILAEVLGYELWFYATIAGLVAIYLTMLCYLKFMGLQVSPHKKQATWLTDLKLMFVPLIFFLLRLWSAIIDIIHFSTLRQSGKTDSLEDNEGFYALVLLAGIGDSAQGLANAILFCVFTKQVREKLLKSLRSRLRCSRPKYPVRSHSSPLGVSIHCETTTQVDEESFKYTTYVEQSGQLTTRDNRSVLN